MTSMRCHVIELGGNRCAPVAAELSGMIEKDDLVTDIEAHEGRDDKVHTMAGHQKRNTEPAPLSE